MVHIVSVRDYRISIAGENFILLIGPKLVTKRTDPSPQAETNHSALICHGGHDICWCLLQGLSFKASGFMSEIKSKAQDWLGRLGHGFSFGILGPLAPATIQDAIFEAFRWFFHLANTSTLNSEPLNRVITFKHCARAPEDTKIG